MRTGFGTVLFAIGITTGLLLAAVAMGGDPWLSAPRPTGSASGSSPASSGPAVTVVTTVQPVIYLQHVVTATPSPKPTVAPSWTPRPTAEPTTVPTATPHVWLEGGTDA